MAGACLTAATATSLTPSLTLKYMGTAGTLNWVFEHSPDLGPFLIVAAIVFASLDFQARNPHLSWYTPRTTLVLGFLLLLPAAVLVAIRPTAGVSESAATTGDNSPIVGQGSVTYNEGVSEELLERLLARDKSSADATQREMLRAALDRTQEEARKGRALAKRALTELSESGNPTVVIELLLALADEMAKDERQHDDLLDIYAEIGSLAFLQRDFRKASEYLSRTLAERPNDRESVVLMGHVQLRQGHDDEAERAYRFASTLCEDLKCKAGMLLNLGVVFVARRQFHEALAAFNDAYDMIPRLDNTIDLAAITSNQAMCLMELGRPKEARSKYHEAVLVFEQAWPQHASHLSMLYYGWGVLELSQGESTRAEALINDGINVDKSIGNDWGLALGRMNLATVYLAIGRMTDAEVQVNLAMPTLKTIGSVDQVGKGYYELGEIHRSQRRLDLSEVNFREGIAYLERAERTDQTADLRSGLAATLLLRGDYDQAIKEVKAAIEVHERLKNNAALAVDYSNLGLTYRRMGNLDEADAHLNKALDLAIQVQDKSQELQHRYNLGLVKLNRGHLDEAERIFLELLPKQQNAAMQEAVAITYEALGAVSEGRGDSMKAKQYFTDSRDAFRDLGRNEQAEEMQKRIDMQ